MRAKRSKKYRKIVSAYQLTFSFREPYQILLDGAFLRTCHAFHMPLQKYLDNTMHGQCKMFVTKCTLAKIMEDHEKQQKSAREASRTDANQSGGDKSSIRRPRQTRPEFLPPPTDLPLRHCRHKNDQGEDIGIIDEAHCLLDLLAGQPHGNERPKNKQHYILATADALDSDRRRRGFIDVREKARLIPGVPIIYVKRSVMILEELSGASEAVRRGQEKDKIRDGLVGSRKRKRGENETENSEGEGDEFDDILDAYDHTGPKIRGQRKAKAPNPMSVRSKKVKVQMPFGKKQTDLPALEDVQNSAGRIKRRGKRGKKSGDEINGDLGVESTVHDAGVAV